MRESLVIAGICVRKEISPTGSCRDKLELAS